MTKGVLNVARATFCPSEVAAGQYLWGFSYASCLKLATTIPPFWSKENGPSRPNLARLVEGFCQFGRMSLHRKDLDQKVKLMVLLNSAKSGHDGTHPGE